jgi:hypothetical protein
MTVHVDPCMSYVASDFSRTTGAIRLKPDPTYEAFVFDGVLGETKKLGYLLHMMRQVL